MYQLDSFLFNLQGLTQNSFYTNQLLQLMVMRLLLLMMMMMMLMAMTTETMMM
jgi:hypothetical protein